MKNKKIKKTKKRSGIQKIGCAIFLAGLFLINVFPASHVCFALPEPDSVVSGSAEISYPDVNTLKIDAADKAIINYKSFDIKQNESVIINLPNVNNEILNRVLGNKASEIMGNLTCNGIFILVNKNGIVFGPNANVDVGSMIVSTRDITNSDFLSSQHVFGKLSSDQLDTLLLNQGKITIRDGGFGVFIAGGIENQGTIVAPIGTIAMAAGDLVKIDISANGLISVAIDQAVASTVKDLQGNPITDQIKNTGTIEANGGTVLLKAEAMADIFEKAINLEGYVRADKFEQKDGLVKIISSGKVEINGEVSATNIIIGKTDEAIPSSLTMNKGTLTAENAISIVAGSISANTNAPITQIYKKLGDLSIFSSKVADNLATLLGDNVNLTYIIGTSLTLQTDNNINTTSGVIIQANQVKLIGQKIGSIETPVTIQANLTYINRINGNIDIMDSQGMGSTVMLRGPPSGFGAIIYNKDTNLVLEAQNITFSTNNPTYFYGNITFYNFNCQTPDKEFYFEAGKTYTFKGNTYIKGTPGYDGLIKLLSNQEGNFWYSDFSQAANVDISYVAIQDAYSLNQPIKVKPSTNWGNCVNWDTDPIWRGQTANLYWSEALNWDTGTIPTAYDVVTFDNINNTNSYIDSGFGGTIATLNIDGYTGTITLQRSLTITGDITLASGTLTAGSQILTVGGNWNNQGGTFQADTSTVIFNDANQISNITGNNTFYNLTCITPGKTLNFQTGSLTTINNLLTIEGEPNNPIVLKSSLSGEGNEFNIYINAVSDNHGTAYLRYLNVYDSDAQGPITPIPARTINKTNCSKWDANRYWVASSTANWNSSNWSLNSGDVSGASVPGADDTAIFDGGGGNNGNCTINVDVNVLELSINGYTGTITQNAGTTITIGAGGYSQITSASTFTGSNSAADTVTMASFIFSGPGTFNAPKTLNISGSFTTSGSPTFNNNSGTITFTGTGTVNSAVAFYNVTINTSGTVDLGANLDIDGSLTLTAGTLDVGAISSYDIYVAGSWTATGAGIFTNRSHSVYFNGTGTINSNQAFYGLTVNTSGTITLGADLNVDGTFYIQAGTLDVSTSNYDIYASDWTVTAPGIFNARAGTVIFDKTSSGSSINSASSFYNFKVDTSAQTLTLGTNIDIDGNLTITSGTLSVGGSNYEITVGGSWTDTGAGTFSEGTGKVTFDGTGTINSNDNFYDLTVNTSSAITLGADLDVDGNLTITSGTLDLNGKNLVLAATTTFSNTGTLQLQGGETLTNFTNDTNSGTIVYNGTGTYTSLNAGNAYYHLTFNGSGSWALNAALDVDGNLTITTGTLDLNGKNLDLAGTFSNTGTLQLQGGETLTGFTNDTNSGTIVYDGTGTYTSLNAGNAYYHLTFNGSGSWTLNANLDVDGNLTITTGTLAAGAKTITVSGNWANSGTFTANTSTVTFDGSGAAQISGSTSFYNLTCTTAAKPLTFAAGSTQTITGTTTLTGTSGNNIVLRSSSSGTQWKINPQGTRSVSYVDVKDSNNINSLIISPTNSTNSGNNTNWFASTTPDPAHIDTSTEAVNLAPNIETIITETIIINQNQTIIIDNSNIVNTNTQLASASTPAASSKDSGNCGFDYAKVKESDQKFKKPYLSGKYKTIVIVFEGKVVVAPYDEKGIKSQDMITLTSGQQVAQTAEIKNTK